MQLIMENWRNFVAEAEKSKAYGDLCLFEGKTVQKVSFYDRFVLLNEGEHDFDTFFEQWERSANYELDRLDEVDWKALKENPVLYLSTQAYVLIGRAKDKIFKHIGKIKAILSRASAFLQRFEESNPKLYKVGTISIKVAVALVATTALQTIVGSLGGDAGSAQAGVLTHFGGSELPYSEEQLKGVGELLIQFEGEDFQKMGQELIDISSGENVDVHDFAAKVGMEDGTARELRGVIEQGIEKLAEIDANAAEAAQQAADSVGETETYVQSSSRFDPSALAQHTIGQGLRGDEDALQKLIDLQNHPAAPEALEGVDLSSLDEEGFYDLLDQLQGEGHPLQEPESAGVDVLRPGEASSRPTGASRAELGQAVQTIKSKLKR